ncbi:MAG: shikimate kinase [Burkholderiales bacterium]|nr:shikimate kinase [Burkholderiales bacterium]
MLGNIFLVGMMGAGKTTIGKALAKKLERKFLDTDQEVVRRTGVAIPIIFDIEGEAGFRSREQAVLEELTQMNDIVLAMGGGIVLHQTNRDILKSRGTVIYLRANAEDLWRRTRRDRGRPLLQTPHPLETLRTLYGQRDPLYQEVADVIIDTGSQSVQRLLDEIEQKLDAFSARPL